MNKGARQTLAQSGKPCAFCLRVMDVTRHDLRPTRDHYPVPRSAGGRVIVWCCWVCNAVKRDMTAEQWDRYRAQHPEWWDGYRARKAMRWRPNQSHGTGKPKWGPWIWEPGKSPYRVLSIPNQGLPKSVDSRLVLAVEFKETSEA